MLRVSSAGLTSAFTSPASAFRPCKVSFTTLTARAVFQPDAPHFTQVCGIRLLRANSATNTSLKKPLATPTHSNQEGNPGEGGATTRKGLRVKRDSLRATQALRSANQNSSSKGVRFQRAKTGPRLFNAPRTAPGLHYRKGGGGSINRALHVLEASLSRAGRTAVSSATDNSVHDFRLHPKIAGLMFATLPENLATTVVHLLRTAAAGRNLEESWSAYTELLHLQSSHPLVSKHLPQIPNAVLHRLARHIARTRPVTRRHFGRLLRVLQNIWDMEYHKTLSVEAWNVLINTAGKGWRTGSVREYDVAVGVFNDMVGGMRPGTHFSTFHRRMVAPTERRTPTQPDLCTFNTLLSIAARSLSRKAVDHALRLLRGSGFQPDWITYMALIVHHMRCKNLPAIRGTIRKMNEQGLAIPLEGVNAIMYGYAYNGRQDVVLQIYRILRDNVVKDADTVAMKLARHRLVYRQSLQLGREMEPDVVTYTLAAQASAYAGEFSNAFGALDDFLTTEGKGRVPASAGPIFRAIFLGFKRHAVGPTTLCCAPSLPLFTLSPKVASPDLNKKRPVLAEELAKWNLENLETVYDLFMQIPLHVKGSKGKFRGKSNPNFKSTATSSSSNPDDGKRLGINPLPTRSTIFWIMCAFDKTTGGDVRKLRAVWLSLRGRFERRKPELFTQRRLVRLERILFSREMDERLAQEQEGVKKPRPHQPNGRQQPEDEEQKEYGSVEEEIEDILRRQNACG